VPTDYEADSGGSDNDNPFGGSQEVSFPAKDGGVVYADLYGTGDHCVVLVHGMKFDKASWKEQASQLASAGFRVAAIDLRGYGKSHGGPKSSSPRDEMYLDVLAAADYLRGHGAKTVAVIGASMGGGASANAAIKGAPRLHRSPGFIGSGSHPESRTNQHAEAVRHSAGRSDHAAGEGTI